ncbi:MAG: flagellar basal body rod C-terminal domain-containing protein [Actinomycetota bacterium]
MSDMFSALSVATSGMGAYKTWLNAVADNIANADNITSTSNPAFQERFVQVQAATGDDGIGDGVRVAGVTFGDPQGRVISDPNNPLADAKGMVRQSSVDMTEQMVHMQLAQRGYQANVSSFQAAKQAYEAILSIGK